MRVRIASVRPQRVRAGALVAAEDGQVASLTAKGSGAVTSFSQADGVLEIDALGIALDAGLVRASR